MLEEVEKGKAEGENSIQSTDLNGTDSTAGLKPKESSKSELDDILIKDSSSKTIFNRYRKKEDIANEILKILLNKKYNNSRYRKLPRGFYNNDIDRSQVGLFTQCIGMQAISSLSNFGIDMKDYLEIINYTLSDIFQQIGFTKEAYNEIVSMGDKLNFSKELLKYNMTPFIKSEDYGEEDGESITVNTCVESACNVLKAVVEAREMIINQIKLSKKTSGTTIEFTFNDSATKPEDFLQILEYLIKYTIGWITDACIKTNQEINYSIDGKMANNSRVAWLGWNFFKIANSNEGLNEEYEPSLYMTYSVCSSYITLLQSVEEPRNAQVNANPSYRYLQNERMYKLIKNEFELLKIQCMSAGRYEEMRVNGLLGNPKIDLNTKFIGQSYVATDYLDIENSTTNDSVISTVLHVLILIYSGIDIDYKILDKGEIFFDDMQYTLQNVLRCYKRLLKSDKTYIIEQYFLSFREKMPSSVSKLAKLLRRQRIQVASLLPLLIQAFNEISKYLVKYPQKQNIDYLKLILENRTEADGVKEWAWDKDGYNITSENYFIKALLSFYEYYEEYEECYIDSEQTISSERDRISREAEEKIRLNSEKSEQEKEVLEKKIKELEARTEPLVKEVVALIEKTVSENLTSYLIQILQSSIENDCKDKLSETISNYVAIKYFGTRLKNDKFDITNKAIIERVNDCISNVYRADILNSERKIK